MPALTCHYVGMSTPAHKKKIQYTIRNVAPSVDRSFRKKAREQKKSLNQVLIEALQKEAGVVATVRVYDDLDSLIGSWVRDPETEKALQEARKVDPRDWE